MTRATINFDWEMSFTFRISHIFLLEANHPDNSKQQNSNENPHKISQVILKIAVVASWGRPNDINRSVGSWGIHEQWVYGGYPSSSKATYVYFEDARVTSWQD